MKRPAKSPVPKYDPSEYYWRYTLITSILLLVILLPIPSFRNYVETIDNTSLIWVNAAIFIFFTAGVGAIGAALHSSGQRKFNYQGLSSLSFWLSACLLGLYLIWVRKRSLISDETKVILLITGVIVAATGVWMAFSTQRQYREYKATPKEKKPTKRKRDPEGIR